MSKKGEGDEGENGKENGEGGEEADEHGEYRPFEKKVYTDEAFQDLMKELHKRVWGRHWED